MIHALHVKSSAIFVFRMKKDIWKCKFFWKRWSLFNSGGGATTLGRPATTPEEQTSPGKMKIFRVFQNPARLERSERWEKREELRERKGSREMKKPELCCFYSQWTGPVQNRSIPLWFLAVWSRVSGSWINRASPVHPDLLGWAWACFSWFSAFSTFFLCYSYCSFAIHTCCLLIFL